MARRFIMKPSSCSRCSFQESAVLALTVLLLVPVTVDAVSAVVTPVQSPSTTKDVQKIIAILVEFPDLKHSVDRGTIIGRLTELDVFFREVSYGLAWISADVTEKWYEVPTLLSKYDIQKWGFNDGDMSDFRRKAISLADPDVNFRNYNYIIIVATGKVWAHAVTSASSNNDGVSRLDIAVLNEQSQMGTYAHELGHLMPSEYKPRGGRGLPDLYSYDAAKKDQPASVFVGPWCIMDTSKTARHFCAWSKIMLGWIAPELVRPSATQVLLFTIRSLEMDSGLRAVEVTLRDDLYYVIEVREGKGYDRNLPGEGVLIYLVDESKKGGYGVVRVADRNSLTKLLDDAPFRVGDMFEDDENSVYVAVVLEEESGFTVAISGSKILSLKDADGDGLFDHVEERLGTDPRKPDSDGDGMTDGEEVNKYKTSPVKRDSDGDGLSDGDEVKKFRTNPLLADTDNDALPDGDEVNKYHTDPLNADTDRDGSSDYEEVKYGTNPLEPDTDGDGVIDGDETTFGTNPLQWDTDGDLWNDGLDVAPKNPLVPNILLVAVAAVAVLIVAVRRKRSSVRTRYAPRSSEVTSAQMTGAVQTKYCSECGFALSLGANSCSKCGARQSYYGDGGD